ncbi:hypothetical protein Golob_012389, partial [Gossypium lobatum]|nr:hypothetical protein [Gossypium lobatum]
AFSVTVRNKKRVGYTYELTLKVKGEWHLREEKKTVKGHIDIPEFSFGELDDLQMAVQLSEEKDFVQQDKQQIIQDLKKRFLQPVREKLLQFEQELKDRGHKIVKEQIASLINGLSIHLLLVESDLSIGLRMDSELTVASNRRRLVVDALLKILDLQPSRGVDGLGDSVLGFGHSLVVDLP